jgi:hypothetical protein
MRGTERTIVRYSGLSTLGGLGIAFVVLRLTGTIDWPWPWVLAPFWVPVALAFTIYLLALVVVLAEQGLRAWLRRRDAARRERQFAAGIGRFAERAANDLRAAEDEQILSRVKQAVDVPTPKRPTVITLPHPKDDRR